MKKIMEMLQNMKAKNEKKDNKGFSLVELIIVIAIMAILVGVVGTQVLPYIDKSRHAKDVQVLSGLCTDGMTAYSSNAATLTADEYVITIGKSAAEGATDAVSVSGGTSTEQTTLKKAFTDLNNVKTVADLNLESKASNDITSIAITCKSSGDMISVHANMKSGSKYSFDDITSK